MKSLPQGWVSLKASDICQKVQSGSTPRNNPFTEFGDVPYLKVYNIVNQKIDFQYRKQFISKDIHEKKLARSIVYPNDVLMNIVGPPLGKIALVGDEYPEWNINQAITLFRVDKDIIDHKYLFYFLNEGSALNSILGDLKGTVGQINISLTQCRLLDVPLCSLPEQKRIVAKLDEVLAQVDTIKARLDGIPAILKRFRQSVLAAAVSGKLTEEWRGSNSKKHWARTKFKDLTESISDGDHQAPPKADVGIPFLVISNVSTGVINFDNISRWVPEEYFNSLKDIRVPQKGDLLYTVTGSFGIPVKVDVSERFCFQRHIAIIKTDASRALRDYLYYLLLSPVAFKQAEDTATGTAQKTVSLTSLRNFEFDIAPLDEQKEIVRLVDQYFTFADTIEAQVKKAQARVDNLTQSILAKAFRGELVPQDPDDEPAEDLLKRIASARKEAEALAKAAKKAAKAPGKAAAKE